MSARVSADVEEVHGVSVRAVSEVNDPAYDALVVVTGAGAAPPLPLPQALEDFILAALELDRGLDETVGVLNCARVSGRRLVLSPVGELTPYHDVRSVGAAMGRGVARAAAAGSRRVCVAVLRAPQWERAPLVALLAALEALYVPLQIRESFPEKSSGVTALGVYAEGLGLDVRRLIRDAAALERARGVARDVGGADGERMAPAAVAAYCRALFASSRDVTVRVEDSRAVFEEKYPLFAAVDRAAHAVPRHRGCIVFLEYVPEHYEQTAMLVGKGVTYDTGGCDVKTGGAMCGMSRDKCGAAAVLGFVQACSALGARVKVVAALAMVRNSIGEEAYVADELIRTRSGLALRVGNTDAEGRMAMADLLAEMSERAGAELRPHLYTVATLTGHAHRAYGPYTAVMDNHVARELAHAERLAAGGAALGEPAEVSRIRREDLAAHAARARYDDIQQADALPSTAVPRGHQGPAAFLLLAAGLAGAGAGGQLPYTHLDVAGSAGSLPAPPTAAPLLALAHLYNLITYDK